MITDFFDAHKLPAKLIDTKETPNSTIYSLMPRLGVKAEKMVTLASSLSIHLDSHANIKIRNNRVEVSIKKEKTDLVKFVSPEPSPLLPICLGIDENGDQVTEDLATMPHLLIAGATGSGKSVCINSIVCSLLENPWVSFFMIDPKKVELDGYNRCQPLVSDVAVTGEKAMNVLIYLNQIMDHRYGMFKDAQCRNITEYDAKVEPLSRVVLIIDEMADLMLGHRKKVEPLIVRLAQLARAAGIHIVAATQRPSSDIITGLIKANFPCRIAFRVATKIESRIILDVSGAESLLGKGDMYYMNPKYTENRRLQGCFLSDNEIENIIEKHKGTEGRVSL